MNTIDIDNDGNINMSETFTFTADIWMPNFPDDNKENIRKARIEKILRSLNDKERT